MMLDAMTALLSFPRVTSQRLRRSRMTVTRKRFSCSSCEYDGRVEREGGEGEGVSAYDGRVKECRFLELVISRTTGKRGRHRLFAHAAVGGGILQGPPHPHLTQIQIQI